MALPARKGYSGSGISTTLTSSPTLSDTTFTVTATTNWPTTYPFYVVVDPGTTKEEKMKVTGVSSLTVTVARGQDNTSAVAHSSGSVCYPVFTALEADEANKIASAMTTKGDLIATDGSAINRLAVGTNTHVLQADSSATNGIKWAQVATGGIADNAVTLAKLATAVQNFLIPVGTIQAYAGGTAPTGWLLCDGSTFNATTYSALNTVLGGNTTPDLRGKFLMGKAASGTGSTLLGSGGSATIAEGNLPSHSHGVGTLATATGGSHGHTASSASAGGHDHTASSTSAGSHSHTISVSDPGHNHTQNAHSHSTNVTFIYSTSHVHNNEVNYLAAGQNGSTTGSINPNGDTTATNISNTTGITASSGSAGSHSHTITVDAVASHSHTITVDSAAGHTHTMSGSTAAVGSGTAYYQPFVAVSYIIKHD